MRTCRILTVLINLLHPLHSLKRVVGEDEIEIEWRKKWNWN